MLNSSRNSPVSRQVLRSCADTVRAWHFLCKVPVYAALPFPNRQMLPPVMDRHDDLDDRSATDRLYYPERDFPFLSYCTSTVMVRRRRAADLGNSIRSTPFL